MSYSKLLRKVMIEVEVTQTELAKRTNQSQQNLSNKIKNDNFTIYEFEELLNALGCSLEINVRLPDGKCI